jgi:hypothetical protein
MFKRAKVQAKVCVPFSLIAPRKARAKGAVTVLVIEQLAVGTVELAVARETHIHGLRRNARWQLAQISRRRTNSASQLAESVVCHARGLTIRPYDRKCIELGSHSQVTKASARDG